jgi:dTDP-4-dehydrorhamnose 3,5-epimerase
MLLITTYRSNGLILKTILTEIEDVLIIEPKLFEDDRGFFKVTWNQKDFNETIDEDICFVQDNHSRSSKGVLRGLHYQNPKPQGKLVRLVYGRVLDVVLDLRKRSPTFGEHLSLKLSAEKHQQLWIPRGCAHGFVVLSDVADLLYKTTSYYAPEYERCIKWNDPYLAIDWQISDYDVKLSDKDQNGATFKNAIYFK